MNRLKQRLQELRSDDAAVLPLVTLVLVVLLGMAAFATDLGWLYVNATRVQRAADAGALAGVIHLPGFPGIAANAAGEATVRNGYDGAASDVTVTAVPVAGQSHRLNVTVTDTAVETFFLKVFGMNQVTITRDATAEYAQPLAIGSPENIFGFAPTQGYWAAIQAPFTKKEHGDPFAVACVLSTDDEAPCDTSNASEYRPSGYYYSVEIPVGSGITQFQVQAYDGGFYNGPIAAGTGDFRWNNGGSQCPGCEPSGAAGDLISGATVHYQMYNADPTPLDHLDNPPAACPGGISGLTLDPEDTSPNTEEPLWTTVCSFNSGVVEGPYPLQIRTSSTGHAMNAYALRACSPTCAAPAGVQPRVAGINDISIWTNVSGGTATFFFSEVDQINAGKTLIMRLFDPGDADSNNSITVIGPDPAPGVNSAAWGNCSWTSTAWQTGNTEFSGGPGGCVIDATRSSSSCGTTTVDPGCRFNGDWLEIIIPLPTTYTCDPIQPPAGDGCWWKVRYNYSSGDVTDRTTWAAEVIGTPVHLVVDP